MAKSAIGPVVEITDQEIIEDIKASLDRHVSILEIAINADGVRFKVNWGVWSPPFGKITSEEW